MKSKELPEEKREKQREIIERLATKIVERRLTAPAVLFLESAKPLSFLGNQALVFFQPIVQTVFNFRTYDEITDLLEDRDNVEHLLKKIEELEAQHLLKSREAKERRREEKRAAKSSEDGADE
jgi:hypothetical protein